MSARREPRKVRHGCRLIVWSRKHLKGGQHRQVRLCSAVACTKVEAILRVAGRPERYIDSYLGRYEILVAYISSFSCNLRTYGHKVRTK